MANNNPNRKINAAGAAGLLATIIVWILNVYLMPEDKNIPPQIAAAFAGILMYFAGRFWPEK